MKQCPICQTSNDEQALFCAECGHRFQAAAPPASEASSAQAPQQAPAQPQPAHPPGAPKPKLHSPVLGTDGPAHGEEPDFGRKQKNSRAKAAKKSLRSPLLAGSEDIDDEPYEEEIPKRKSTSLHNANKIKKAKLRSPLLGDEDEEDFDMEPSSASSLPKRTSRKSTGHKAQPSSSLRSPLLGGDDDDYDEPDYQPAGSSSKGSKTRLRSPVLGGGDDFYDPYEDDLDVDEDDPTALRSPLLRARSHAHEKKARETGQHSEVRPEPAPPQALPPQPVPQPQPPAPQPVRQPQVQTQSGPQPGQPSPALQAPPQPQFQQPQGPTPFPEQAQVPIPGQGPGPTPHTPQAFDQPAQQHLPPPAPAPAPPPPQPDPINTSVKPLGLDMNRAAQPEHVQLQRQTLQEPGQESKVPPLPLPQAENKPLEPPRDVEKKLPAPVNKQTAEDESGKADSEAVGPRDRRGSERRATRERRSFASFREDGPSSQGSDFQQMPAGGGISAGALLIITITAAVGVLFKFYYLVTIFTKYGIANNELLIFDQVTTLVVYVGLIIFSFGAKKS